jgi:hypothetical protein
MDTKIRLLQCHTCKTLEQMPDYQGDPERDDALIYHLDHHKFPDGTPHIGNLMDVAEKAWSNKSYRREIENRIRESSGHTGFDTEFYATKNTLAEDALTCFNRHLRNPGCGDYMTEPKRLNPGTDAERKAEGLPKYRSKTFLCHYCPVHSLATATN